jgi:hypothetical protein
VFYAVCKNDPEILDELEGVIEWKNMLNLKTICD